MKKASAFALFLSVYLCLCLLASCAGSGVPGGTPSVEEQAGGETIQPATVTAACRVVEVGDGNQLLLADTGSGAVYALSGGEAPLLMDGEDGEPGVDWAPKAGALAEITYDGTVQETWPARFAHVTSVNILSDGFDDLCALYLQVLEDLWEADAGLNSGLTYIGVDLSETSLSESERSAVAWAFAGKHGGELVTGTWEELADQGYIDRENLYWEDGILFSITEKTEPVYFMPEGMTAVTFDAEKWRSGLGAYFFCECTAVQTAAGHWDGYSTGSEAIS